MKDESYPESYPFSDNFHNNRIRLLENQKRLKVRLSMRIGTETAHHLECNMKNSNWKWYVQLCLFETDRRNKCDEDTVSFENKI